MKHNTDVQMNSYTSMDFSLILLSLPFSTQWLFLTNLTLFAFYHETQTDKTKEKNTKYNTLKEKNFC
ncbi:uncharacterized protein DS421_18g613940 [Arachis hypogaea]|nr:uncharacterized protein DS421_18g613940 [Arachis hypogaea]